MKKFRILITGSREWDDYETLKKVIIKTIGDYLAEHPELKNVPVNNWVSIVHGHCPKGADYLADYFSVNVLKSQPERYPADWAAFGRSAGFKRNMRMVNSAPDVCLAFIRNKSKGATHCRDLAKRAGIPTETIIYDLVSEPKPAPSERTGM